MMRNWWHGTYLIQFVRLCHRVRALSSRSIVAVRIDWNRIWEEFKIQSLASISSRGGRLVKLRVDKKRSTFPAILQWYNSFSLNPCPWNPDGNKSFPASNVCVQFILVSIRRLPRSKLPIDSFWAPHCFFHRYECYQDFGVTARLWTNCHQHCKIWPIFERCTLQK